MPARVVAPTRVNAGKSSLTERAAGPSPIMMSIWKSSSAGYRISSTTGGRVRSSTSSCGLTGAAAIRRSVSIMFASASCLGEELQRLPDAVGYGNAIGQLLHRMHRFLVAVAQRNKRMQHIGRDWRGAVNADRARYID